MTGPEKGQILGGQMLGGQMLGGRAADICSAAFARYGTPGETGMVLVSIPHAGRDYPAELLARARGGLSALESLEDRHVDCLAEHLVAAGHCAIVARPARAIIDLNRHPQEIDNSSVRDLPRGLPVRTSQKLRGGLGLVPHRAGPHGELWLHLPTYAEVRSRIEQFHIPYHSHIAWALEQILARHGRAILLDLHSMPPLPVRDGAAPTRIVVGDLYGASAAVGITDRAVDHFARSGLRVARNMPYAGGYMLERHGRPARGVDAIQIEIDRTLYLDGAGDCPADAAPHYARMMTGLIDRLNGDLGAFVQPLAAE